MDLGRGNVHDLFRDAIKKWARTKIRIGSPRYTQPHRASLRTGPIADCPPGSRRNYLSEASAPRLRERQGLDLIGGGSRPGLVCRA